MIVLGAQERDLAGLVVGRLTVLDPTELRSYSKSRMWRCLCSCGTETKVPGHQLLSKGTKSCGCLSPGPARTYPVEFRKRVIRFRRDASARGLTVRLTGAEIVKLFTGDCVYCGASPHLLMPEAPGVFRNTIDRIDSSIAYTPDNVAACCLHCNRAKNSMTVDAFKSWVRAVANHLL